MAKPTKTEQTRVFVRLLKEAHHEAAVLAKKSEHNESIHGDAVVVFGIDGRMKQAAVKLGALNVDAGLLFVATPEEHAATFPPIYNRRLWAYWFCGILESHGFMAKIVEYIGEDTKVRI